MYLHLHSISFWQQQGSNSSLPLGLVALKFCLLSGQPKIFALLMIYLADDLPDPLLIGQASK